MDVYGVAANDPQETADEAERGESRASATYARTIPTRAKWLQAVVRGHIRITECPEPQRAVDLSVPSGTALASHAVSAQSERPHPLGPHAAPHHSLAATAVGLSSLPLHRMGVVT